MCRNFRDILIKITYLTVVSIFLVGTITGFESDREDDGEDPPEPDPDVQCWNQEDDDEDGNTPASTGEAGPYNAGDPGWDPGCINPYWEDEIEGLIWSSDITATFEDTPSVESPAPYMGSSFIQMGNDVQSNAVQDSVTGSGDSIEYSAYYVSSEGSESSDDWGFGIREQTTVTGFPEGAITQGDDRVVLPPNPQSDTTGGSTCGDGLEGDEDYDNPPPRGDDETDSPPDFNENGYNTPCREDWGRIYERYDVSSRGSEEPWEPSSQTGNTFTTDTGLECRDDNEDSDGDSLGLECEDGTDATCSSGSSSCGCSSASGSDGSDATCDSANDWSGDEDNEYWIIDGDDLVRESCEVQGTETYATGSSGSDATCTDYSANTDENGTCTGCSSSGSTTWDGGDSDSVSGDNRDWEEVQRQDCQTHDTVDGGSTPNNFYGNSQAGTFTAFTAYDDGNWGDEGRVWCGYDYTTTINADGPYGLGNGFVVVHNGQIIASENPEGLDEVGEHIYVDENNAGYDFENKISTNCPSGKNTCLKYVNFYTDSSGWDIGNNPSEAEVRSAVSVYTETLTPDESYSVCKNINRINDDSDRNSLDDNVIDCDYMRNDGGNHNNISPLTEACGDDENEHLMLMEGPSVDSDATSNWLGHEQKCVSWGDGETDPHGRELDENACVLHGEAYAEGTVMNVASPQNIDDDYEERRQSPDWQVCLDLDDETGDWPYNYRYNDDSNEDFGGQWYDLDDDVEYNGQTVNEYISDQESNGFEAEAIDSEVAGPSANADETWIDYYFTNNPNPQDDDYNPMGGQTGVSLIADCGPRLDGCGDDGDNIRGEIATPSYHDGGNGAGTYFGFSDGDTFIEDSMDDDFHPQGEHDAPIYPEPVFEGQLNLIKSVSAQLDEDHPDYDHLYGAHQGNWWYNTHIDVDRTVQYSYTLDDTYVIDSTGVPYPAGGIGQSESYTDHSDTGAHPHIEYQDSTRASTVDRRVLKNRRAHANSLAVIADQEFTDKEGNLIREGEAFWIDPDDILVHWEEGNIRRNDWN